MTKIHMPEKQLEGFKNWVKASKVYAEFGCGGSTLYASDHCQKVFSVESDKQWIEKISNELTNENVEFIFIDIETKQEHWGHPGDNCSPEKQIKYSSALNDLIEKNKIDTVLIDGRYRTACALKIHSHIDENTVILFDDFVPRKDRHDVILNYYNIIDTIDTMVVLKKKVNTTVEFDLIKKYELISQ